MVCVGWSGCARTVSPVAETFPSNLKLEPSIVNSNLDVGVGRGQTALFALLEGFVVELDVDYSTFRFVGFSSRRKRGGGAWRGHGVSHPSHRYREARNCSAKVGGEGFLLFIDMKQ